MTLAPDRRRLKLTRNGDILHFVDVEWEMGTFFISSMSVEFASKVAEMKNVPISRGGLMGYTRGQFMRIGLAGLGAALVGGSVDAQGTGTQPSFLCIYRPGPRWLPGKPLSEQPLREHGRYMLELYQRGVMRMAGRFADGSGGAMLFGAADESSAQAIVAADPAVVAETFTYELRQWAFVDWAAVAKRRAADKESG